MRTPGLKNKTFPFYPLPLLSFPFIHLWATNIDQHLQFSQLLPPYLLALVISGLLLATGTFLLKSLNKAAFCLSALILIFFSYGHVRNAVLLYVLQTNIPQQFFIAAFLIFCAGIPLLFFFVVPKNSGFKRGLFSDAAASYLNIAASILILIPLTQIAVFSYYEAPKLLQFTDSEPLPSIGRLPAPLPDIYYIILDEYGRKDILKKEYNYDNSPFVEELEKLGFYVPKETRSNYLETMYSLSSSLNMRYLKSPGEDAIQLIRDNRAARILKKAGYQYIFVNSGCNLTDYTPLADKLISRMGTNDIELMLVNTTFLNGFSALFFSDSWRARHLYNFQELGKVPEINGPKFTFAHILLPHPPFVFNKTGGAYEGMTIRFTPQKFNSERYHAAYPEQLQYLNSLVLKLVHQIIEKSAVPPIIILQSDHGIDPVADDWSKPETVYKRSANFTALLLPGGAAKNFYDKISPVNIFRVILKTYFGIPLERLPDKTFVPEGDETVKNPWEDITAKIKSARLE